MRLRYWTKSLSIGAQRNGKRVLKISTTMIRSFKNAWRSTAWVEIHLTASNCSTHSSIMVQTESTLSWSSKFWVSTFWKLSKGTTTKEYPSLSLESLQGNAWLVLTLCIECVKSSIQISNLKMSLLDLETMNSKKLPKQVNLRLRRCSTNKQSTSRNLIKCKTTN